MHGSNLEAKASSHRRRRLLASTAILWAICCSAPAQANDECGTGTVVLCDHGDQEYFNDFDTGITYDPVADLTLIVGGSATIAPTSSLSGELAARWGLAAFHLDLALRHEVFGQTSAEVSGLTFSDELPGTVIRMASGLDWSLLDGMLNISLDAGYAKGNDAEELSATAGLRFSY